MLLNTVRDMEWLCRNHLPKLQGYYIRHGSAWLEGNEDCPSKIRLYVTRNPQLDDPFLELQLINGHYVETNGPEIEKRAALDCAKFKTKTLE